METEHDTGIRLKKSTVHTLMDRHKRGQQISKGWTQDHRGVNGSETVRVLEGETAGEQVHSA